MIIRRKHFTKWDETDTLKGLNDADILAQEKRKQDAGRNALDVGASSLKGAIGLGAAGAAIGGGLGAVGKKGFKPVLKGIGKGSVTAGKYAAIGGAVIGGLKAMNKINKKSEENNFYNNRLQYAQRQAKRRERKDWKTNMTQRENYSY